MVRWKHRSQRFIIYWSITQIQLCQRQRGVGWCCCAASSLPLLCSWHRLHPFTNSWVFFWMNMYMQHASLRRTGPVVWTQTERRQNFQGLLSCKPSVFMIIHPCIHPFSSGSLGQSLDRSLTRTAHSGDYFIYDPCNLHVETRVYIKRKKYSHGAQGEHANTEKP